MHPSALEFVRARTCHIPQWSHVLEVGSRNVNGSLRGVVAAANWHGIDLLPGDGVDEVADATGASGWRPSRRYDLVLCTEVLEHSFDWRAIMLMIGQDALAPGGQVVITTACAPRLPHSGIDGGALHEGEYYGNIVPGEACDVARQVFRAHFCEVDSNAGDLRMVGYA